MSPQFQKGHRLTLLPITYQFPYLPISNYLPISIPTAQRCLSVWWRFVSDDLWNTVVCFQTTQFAYRKGLGTCDAHLCDSHTLESALEGGQEDRIVQIDFSAAFDRVNHHGILYRLSSVGIGGSVLYVLTQYLSNLSQFVLVDGCRCKLVNVVSGVPQGSVLGPFLFLLYLGTFFHSGE